MSCSSSMAAITTTSVLLCRFHTVIPLRLLLARNRHWFQFASASDTSPSSVHDTNRSLFFHLHLNTRVNRQFHTVYVPTRVFVPGLVAFSRREFEDFDGHGSECVDLLGLPEDLMKNVMILSCNSGKKGECSVYLIGTTHVSKESCREVKAVISFLKPEAVFLELCSSRSSILFPKNFEVPTLKETLLAFRKKQNIFGAVYSRFIRKIAKKLGVLPGYEFRVAFDEAKKYGGKVILGDRPVHITLQRTWTKMPFKHKVTMIFSLLLQGTFIPSSKNLKAMLEEMEDPNALSDVIENMGKAYPSLMETLVHERDQYMSAKLVSVAREHGTVVAVVGKGHLEGIKRHWEKPVKMDDLLEIPPRKPLVKNILACVGLGSALAFVFSKICTTTICI